jgi:WhiB family transcriptional regulator, redox-sensing transcriptional regulator
MKNLVGLQNQRWVSHRLTAHQMHSRGQSLDAIADHLQVHKRSVRRYLALPCPEAPQAEPQVYLGGFYMKGACGSFPELDWLSRSPLMQAETKAVCAHCPVLAQCRTFGLNEGLEEAGVWGGMTKAERQLEVRRPPRRTSAPRPQRPPLVAAHQGAA